MNLPIFNSLLQDQSTYITFSKGLLDLDNAHANESEYFYSKMVALNLANYKNPDFFIDYTILEGVTTDNPNTVIPKGMQYYMENIIRQNITNPRVVELAFYKFLNFAGISYANIKDSIVFINKLATSNFTYVENNNGWCEVIAQIPNKSGKLALQMLETDIPDIVPGDQTGDGGIFDNGNMEFDFTDAKSVIDFENSSVLEVDGQLDFNVILLFYRDADGIDKLHGINFIQPFENKITEFELPRYTQKTNDARSIGYQFKFNLKTVNNEASLILIHAWNDHPAWNLFSDTLEKMNSFLEVHARISPFIN